LRVRVYPRLTTAHFSRIAAMLPVHSMNGVRFLLDRVINYEKNRHIFA